MIRPIEKLMLEFQLHDAAIIYVVIFLKCKPKNK